MIGEEDYHIHSTYSDGDLSPEQLVERYAAAGYRRIAITDHDEIEGARLAMRYAAGKAIDVIAGIELSTRDEEGNEIHVLGYGYDLDAPPLHEALSRVKRWRAERNLRLREALAEMGYAVTEEELHAVNEGHYIGKPTFARVLVAKGHAASVDDAFARIFRMPPACLPVKQCLSTAEAIRVLHAAGGVAVFAHPMELRKKGEGDAFWIRFAEILDRMRGWGVDGLECEHPSAGPIEAERLRRMAEEQGMIVTRGSDFHSDRIRRKHES